MCNHDTHDTVNVSPAGEAGLGDSEAVRAALVAYGSSTDGIRQAHKDSVAIVAPGPWHGMDRERREAAQELILAPGATRAYGSGNRLISEEPDARRTCFERDLDRIKHSHAFRRLVGKCQVFLAPDDVHIRNRMTHAIEVAQVGLAIARATGLNETLVEAMALGHDCGHGPGGHASEDAFDPFVAGGYDHALWGADHTLVGLNLCAETLDGIRQHSWRLAAPSTPEGEVLSWADRCAYVAHDADDAIRSGIIVSGDLPSSVRELLGLRQSEQIRSFVTEIIATIEATGRVGMRAEMAAALDDYRKFNYERIYMRPASVEQNERVIKLLRALVEWYADRPHKIPGVVEGRLHVDAAASASAYFAAVSYVSGMTDRYAMTQARTLLGWHSESLPRGV
jgi:dGTPase